MTHLIVVVGLIALAAGIFVLLACLVFLVVRSLRSRAGQAPARGFELRGLAIGGALLVFCISPASIIGGCSPYLFPALWLASVAEQGDPLVQAIRSYEADEGHPPPDLQALVPKYLARIPDTGFGGEGWWEYVPTDTSWRLCVAIAGNPLDFDEFRYAPGTSTSVPVGYRAVSRHGDWLYMDE